MPNPCHNYFCSDNKISILKGIGEKKEIILNEIDVYSIGDLIKKFPKNYEIIPKAINDLTAAKSENKILIRASFAPFSKVSFKNKSPHV